MFAASTAADLSRIVLGVALLAAGVAKVAQGREWGRQAAATGTPAVLARAVPWLELVIGCGPRSSSGAAMPWLSFFSVRGWKPQPWIVAQLAAGRRPPCACFGALSTEPLSWWHVVRNGVLVALGLIAVFG